MMWGAPLAIILAGSFISFSHTFYPILRDCHIACASKKTGCKHGPWPAFLLCLYVVNDRDEPIPIVPDVEDHMITQRISILEDASHVLKFAPVRPLGDGLPRLVSSAASL
jgi:hypothetical protein